MVFLELWRDSRVTTGNSGFLFNWPREVQFSFELRVRTGHCFIFGRLRLRFVIFTGRRSFTTVAVAIAIALKTAVSKDDFIQKLLEQGVTTVWTDKRKHITFSVPMSKSMSLQFATSVEALLNLCQRSQIAKCQL